MANAERRRARVQNAFHQIATTTTKKKLRMRGTTVMGGGLPFFWRTFEDRFEGSVAGSILDLLEHDTHSPVLSDGNGGVRGGNDPVGRRTHRKG